MQSKEYFNDVASQWDIMRKSFFSDDIREKACSVVDVQSGKVAADIGAGTGFITEALISHGLKVIAVDNSKEMLEQMKKKFVSASDIDYQLGESEKLPIDDSAVDYAMANMFLHHVENPFTAIKEMVRILKPGGKLVITDLDEHNHEFLRTEHMTVGWALSAMTSKTGFQKLVLKMLLLVALVEITVPNQNAAAIAQISAFL